ncbi:MAG: ABC transporter ATP-binding protein [Acidobacteriota bacterium]
MSEAIVQIEDLCVRYGRKVALDSVSFDVEEGSLFALLGRNGAGKSSLIKCLLGHLRAASGRIEVLGLDPWKRRAQLMRRVGVVPETPDLPLGMSVGAVGKFCDSLGDFSLEQFRARLARHDLAENASIDELSRGQQTQVQLALALAGTPDLLVLDDPTLGLDAVARQEVFEELIDELSEREVSVLVTTHDLAGIESLATHVAFLREGQLMFTEEVERLKGRLRRVQLPKGERPAGEVVRQRSTPLGEEWIVSGGSSELGEPMTLEEIFVALAGAEDGGYKGPENPTMDSRQGAA